MINVIEEVLAQKGLLVSPEEATALLTRWSAEGYASAAKNLKGSNQRAAPKLAAILLRSAQHQHGQIWLQQNNGDDSMTNAEVLVRDCFSEDTDLMISRAVANTLARIVRFADGDENTGIVFAYAHNLLPSLVKLSISADTEVSSHAQLGTAFVLQMAATMGREIGGLMGAGESVAKEIALLAAAANDPNHDMTPAERLRIWKVCTKMSDIDSAVGRMVGPATIKSVIHHVSVSTDETDASSQETILGNGALEVLHEVADTGKGCAASAVDAGVENDLIRACSESANPAIRCNAFKAAAAFVAAGITPNLTTPLLHSLESALQHDEDSEIIKGPGVDTFAALYGVRILCGTQDGAAMCCSRLGARTAAFAFRSGIGSKESHAAFSALVSLFTCGNGLPVPLLSAVWDSFGYAEYTPTDQIKRVLASQSSHDAIWQLLDALSLHPWASEALLSAPDMTQLLVDRNLRLSELAQESRKQALQNFIQAIPNQDVDAVFRAGAQNIILDT